MCYNFMNWTSWSSYNLLCHGNSYAKAKFYLFELLDIEQ